METFLPFVLYLVLVPVSLYLLSFIRTMGFTDNKKHPPGSKGWPLLGENIEFLLSGTEKFVYTRMEKYSADVFQSSLFGQNIAIFCGPQGNKFLFMNENKQLLTPWFPDSLKKAFGFPEFMEKNPKEMAGPTHKFRHDMFKLEALKDYIPVMDALARQHLDNYWSTPSKVVKVLPMMKKLTVEVACRLLMNLVDPELITNWINPFNEIFQGLFSLPIDFPGTAYNRAIKASKKVRGQIMRIIKERRKELISMQQNSKEMINYTDVLSKMVLEDTQEFSDVEICYNIMGLLMASFETTSVTASAVMCYLAELPHIYEKVFKEQMEITKSKGPDELLTWKDIEKMKYSWNVARETLRLTPVGPGGLGETTTEFTYAGFTIPKGWKTLWTFCSTHMNPEYFPEPKKFDPSRFEGNGPPPNTFVPFGGGPRMCSGKEYARLIILVIMHNVVIRFKLEQVIPNDNFVIHTSATSATGLPLHLQPHDK